MHELGINLNTFEKVNRSNAAKFLQHIVIVDNRLFFRADDEKGFIHPASSNAGKLVTPSGRKKGKVSEEELDSGTTDTQEPLSHNVNAKVLIESFSDKGIICCPYLPSDVEDETTLVNRAVMISKHADIVVLDWKLGVGGSAKAIKIVENIRNSDIEIGGRLRLIAIYTGEKDVNTHYKELFRKLFPDRDALSDDELEKIGTNSSYSIEDKNMKIIFINKEHVDNPQPGVDRLSEKKLPDYLIGKFAEVTDGLMSNISLSSITAIREATHSLLAKYNQTLDPAILTHRALLGNPKDAERFAVELISDEIKSILEAEDVGGEQLGIDKIGLWLKNKHKNGLKFDIRTADLDVVPIAAVIELLKSGYMKCLEHNSWVKKDGAHFYGKKEIGKGVSNLFSTSSEKANESNLDLSRFSSLKREQSERYFSSENWAPHLQLGSVVCRQPNDETREYLLCIQPVCDSVRLPLEIERPFPFLRLIRCESDAKYNLVLQTEEGNECFKISHDPHTIVYYPFYPAKDGIVSATKKNSNFYFKRSSKARISFRWIADIKDMHAQREVQVSSDKLGRVGLNEFEWLRQNRP